MRYFHQGPGHYLVVKRQSSSGFEFISLVGRFVPMNARNPKNVEVTLEQIIDNPQWFSGTYHDLDYYLVLLQLLV